MRRSDNGYSLGSTYLAARDEARRRGDRKISSEHFVLALLAEPASTAAQALGCDLQAAREALDQLDRDALLAVGLDAAPQPVPMRGPQRGRLPLTPGAKAVLQGLPKVAGGRRRLGPEHVLMVLVDRQPPDPAVALFAALGLDRSAIHARLGAASSAG